MKDASGRHDPFAALRVRNYRLFAAGWLPAVIGLQMQATALGWEVYERTHDAFLLGCIGLARALPTFLLALPAGRLIDLLDRRRVLITTQLGFAGAGTLLAFGSFAWERGWLGSVGGLWLMYGLISLFGCVRVFNGPSRSSLLPRILPGGAASDTFHNAVTWNSGVFQFSSTVGPIIAGLLIWWLKAAWPVYALAAAGCLWFAWTSSFIREIEPDTRVRAGSLIDAMRPSALLPGILEGVRHLWREPVVFGAIALDLFAVLLGGATALMPVYAKDILHVGPTGLGALRAAPYVGALVMAMNLAFRPAFKKAGRTPLLSAPDALRGRVAAVNSVFIETSNEVGGFESGLVAKFFGPVASVVSGGIGTLLVVVLTAIGVKELRRLGRLTERK
ncbi:MAG: MFS transporter [Planctomycetes bacterium]|nr:MFS transporter [Planctomycetota bacterium]